VTTTTSPDFYDLLGVSRTADGAEIQRAYRKLARRYHPDVNKDPAAESTFKQVSEAYDVLSDPELRRRYDAFGPDFRRVPDDVDPDGWTRAERRRQSDEGGGFQGTRFTSSFGGDDLSDVFGDLFGDRGRRGWGSIPGADQEAALQLTVEEAYHGGQRSITITNGGQQRNLTVTIPAGVTDGQRIRLSGQGGQGTAGATAGDLYLVVRITPHPLYRLNGRDVTVQLLLTPWEAALGTRVPVATPGGDAKLKVPSGTSSGQRLRLRHRGLPNPRGEAGDLYAEVMIMVPKELSGEERRLFEQLATVSTFIPAGRS
jgi:curved DNA-binding protein